MPAQEESQAAAPRVGWGAKLAFSLPVAAVGILMVASSCASRSEEGQAKAGARAAIAQCWQDQQAAPADARPAAAGACQGLEFDFKTRFRENP